MTQPKTHLSVSNGKSRKQIILEYSRKHDLDRVGLREIQAIQAELRRHNGDYRVAPSYVANVLRQAGARVEFDDRFVDPWMEEPYTQRLAGLLQFGNLAEAEASLHQLDTIYQEYRSASDRVGTGLVRALVIKGRQRAESLARNLRVNPEKRREKEEIARWFKVWLDVSDLFFDWLEMRKQSEEFRQQFGQPNGHKNGGAPKH